MQTMQVHTLLVVAAGIKNAAAKKKAGRGHDATRQLRIPCFPIGQVREKSSDKIAEHAHEQR